MALWFTTPQIGIRRDVQIISFNTSQKFTVSEEFLFNFYLFIFFEGIYH
jgi:hypothetical protein